MRPATLRPSRERRDQPVRQDPPDLVEVRLEIVGDLDHRVTRARLGADTREARGPRLGLCHADGVLVGHPRGQVARDDGADLLVRRERCEAREIAARVRGVLIVEQTGQRVVDDGPHNRGKRREVGGEVCLCVGGPVPLPPNPLICAGSGHRSDAASRRRRVPGRRQGEADVEAFEVGGDGDAAGLDGFAIGLHGDGQRAAAGQRAEQHRVYLGAAGVEGDEAPRAGARQRVEPLARIDRAAGGRFFVNRVEPVRAAHDGRPAGRDEAGLDHTGDLEILGREQHIQRAGNRIKRKGGILGGGAIGQQLDVIGGRAGPLRHARNRRAVRAIAVERRGLDDPFGQHTTALSTDRGNQQ